MKTILFSCCALPLLLSNLAEAGINGTYKVRGTETEAGDKYSFSGSVKVASYLNGTYALKFSDGDSATYKFKFTKPLKETTASQTVTARNSIGTSTATFYSKSGKRWVKFSYKSLDGSVKGQGTGSK
ncbi:MAG: hypothetical protein V4640_03420 [Verrucomicrobiota bacterium]